MRVTTLLNKLLNLPGLWVQDVSFEPEGLVIHVRPRRRLLTCPVCGTRVRGRFQQSRRRWRHLAIWGQSTWIEGPIRRLRCPSCKKVKTEAVPWARHDSDFTRTSEDVVGLLAQKLDRTAVAELTGVSWRTGGSIAERIVAEHLHEGRFEGAGAHRRRRDQLPASPPLPDRGHRPRPAAGDLGRRGQVRRDPGSVLRAARVRARRQHRASNQSTWQAVTSRLCGKLSSTRRSSSIASMWPGLPATPSTRCVVP